MTSRRSHVVRSEDKGGVGPSRSLGNCNVFCDVQDCGDISAGNHSIIASIPIRSSRDYQRCFVSATIGSISASIPDPPPPPGPGTWKLRFEKNIQDQTWVSPPYYSFGIQSTVTVVNWGGLPESWLAPQPNFVGIEKYDGFWWQTLMNMSATQLTASTEYPDPPLVLDAKIRMSCDLYTTEPAWIELTLSSPNGEGQEDVVISDG